MAIEITNPKLLNFQLDELRGYLSKTFEVYDATDNVVTEQYLTYPNTEVGQQCLKRVLFYADASNPTLPTSEYTVLDDWTQAMEDAANPPITDITIADDNISTDSPADSLVGTLAAVGGTAPIVFVITADPDDKFKISNVNELRLSDAVGSSPTTHDVTIQATDARGKTYSEVLTINVTAFSNTTSISFDGVNEYATMPSISDVQFTRSDAFSISFWCKSATNTRFLLNSRSDAADSGIEIVHNASDKVAVSIFNTAPQETRVASTASISTSLWNYVVYTYDGSGDLDTGSTIYIDGVAGTTTELNDNTAGVILTTEDWELGRDAVAPGSYLDGNIDEFSIFNKELSASEVTTLYNSGTPIDPTVISNCIHWYRMGDGDTVPTLQDSVGSNDITTTNMDASNKDSDVP